MQKAEHIIPRAVPSVPWHVATIVGALSVIYASTLAHIARQWWFNENYSHGLLVPLLIFYVLWAQRKQMREAHARPSPVAGGGVAGLALLVAWAGAVAPAFLLQWVSLLMLVVGVVAYYRGVAFLKFVAVPLLLLALSIPLPNALFTSITAPLQLIASRFAVWAMRLLTIPVVGEGNIVEILPYGALRPHKLAVVEACSGIRSLMTLQTMSLLFAFVTFPTEKRGAARPWYGRYGFWRTAAVVASAIPLAVLMNSVRVGGTGVLAYHYGMKAADGFFHAFSGVITYVVSFALLLALGWLLDFARRKAARPSPARA